MNNPHGPSIQRNHLSKARLAFPRFRVGEPRHSEKVLLRAEMCCTSCRRTRGDQTHAPLNVGLVVTFFGLCPLKESVINLATVREGEMSIVWCAINILRTGREALRLSQNSGPRKRHAYTKGAYRYKSWTCRCNEA